MVSGPYLRHAVRQGYAAFYERSAAFVDAISPINMINDSVKAAKAANERSEKAGQEIAEQLKAARAEANEIVAAARDQSAQMLVDSEKEAGRRAESLVESAKAQLSRDVEAARKTLRSETANLVALATEKVVGETIDDKHDNKIIDRAINNAEKNQKGAGL